MIKKRALRYLGVYQEDQALSLKIDEYLKELDAYVHFKEIHQIYYYDNGYIEALDYHVSSKDLLFYLEGCTQIAVVSATLGVETERYLRRLSKSDMSKCVIMDAIASALLETKMDEYETCFQGNRTYRFAPGYGDLPLSMNRLFYQVLQLNKRLGITLTDTDLFIPQKTILAIIGLGQTKNKSCHHCIRYDDCDLRKENQQCWKD